MTTRLESVNPAMSFTFILTTIFEQLGFSDLLNSKQYVPVALSVPLQIKEKKNIKTLQKLNDRDFCAT